MVQKPFFGVVLWRSMSSPMKFLPGAIEVLKPIGQAASPQLIEYAMCVSFFLLYLIDSIQCFFERIGHHVGTVVPTSSEGNASY